jgi:hypothetical protein
MDNRVRDGISVWSTFFTNDNVSKNLKMKIFNYQKVAQNLSGS